MRVCAVVVHEVGFQVTTRCCEREAVARLTVRRPDLDGQPGFSGWVCARHRDEARDAYDVDVLDVAPPLRIVND